MKQIIYIFIFVVSGLWASADTALVFGFDNNTEPNGIRYNGEEQNITFSGAISAVDQTNFNALHGVEGAVNFSIGAVGDLLAFSGIMTPVGGHFNIGASGAGIDATGSDSAYLDQETEAIQFVFSHDVYLIRMNYYDPEPGQQKVLVNGFEVGNSPYDGDFTDNIFVQAGETLTFGYTNSGADSYGIDDFEINVVPEPMAFSLVGIGGLLLIVLRRINQRRSRVS